MKKTDKETFIQSKLVFAIVTDPDKKDRDIEIRFLQGKRKNSLKFPAKYLPMLKASLRSLCRKRFE